MYARGSLLMSASQRRSPSRRSSEMMLGTCKKKLFGLGLISRAPACPRAHRSVPWRMHVHVGGRARKDPAPGVEPRASPALACRALGFTLVDAQRSLPCTCSLARGAKGLLRELHKSPLWQISTHTTRNPTLCMQQSHACSFGQSPRWVSHANCAAAHSKSRLRKSCGGARKER